MVTGVLPEVGGLGGVASLSFAGFSLSLAEFSVDSIAFLRKASCAENGWGFMPRDGAPLLAATFSKVSSRRMRSRRDFQRMRSVFSLISFCRLPRSSQFKVSDWDISCHIDLFRTRSRYRGWAKSHSSGCFSTAAMSSDWDASLVVMWGTQCR